jgi:hypothetical protein
MNKFIVDKVFPARRVHLVGGVSNVGKTRWLIPAMVDWAAGRPVLGKQSHPGTWAYVAADRLLEEAEDTIQGMRVALSDVQIVPAFGQHHKSWTDIVVALSKLHCDVAVVESFGDFAGDRGSRAQVLEFLSRASAMCQPTQEFPNGLTIIGVMESPKLKPYERYKNPRELISGVAGWGYHTSTDILIQAVEKDEEMLTGNRRMYVSLKNGLNMRLTGSFDSGGKLVF